MSDYRFKIKNDEDLLDRKKVAVKYVDFVNKLKGNHTIALDSPWGTGKSTFIDYMCDEFDREEESVKTKDIYIKYNAWENDYTNEPLLSLINEFFEKVKEKNLYREDELKDLMTHSYNAVKKIGKASIKGLINKAIGDEAASEIESALNAGTQTATDLIIDNTFKELSESKKSREEFINELESVTKKILEEKEKDKLIFIIDELDRCKPTFAIELLESIKHLFSINEIVFLIAVDKEQLSESIKAVYGSGFDSRTYLQRFFDIKLHLPVIQSERYFNTKFKDMFQEEYEKDDTSKYIKLFEVLCEHLNLTLRDIEKILNEVLMYSIISGANIKILLVLLTIKQKEYKLYKEICNNKKAHPKYVNQIFMDKNNNKNYHNLFVEVEFVLGNLENQFSQRIVSTLNLLTNTEFK